MGMYSTRGALSVPLPVEFMAVDPPIVVGVMETGGRSFVENYGRSRMKLKRGTGANRGEGTFDHVLDGADFRGAKSKQ